MLRKSSRLGMCAAPGQSLLLCICFLWLPLSRANEFASRKASRSFEDGFFPSKLPATFMEEFNNASWYDSIAKRQYSDGVGNRVGAAVLRQSGSDGGGEETSEPTMESPASTEAGSTDETDGVSATPSASAGSVLFKEAYVCRSGRSIWNVAVLNKMGELLVPTFAMSSEAKATEFVRCIREDLTDMAREDYLTFAMYNCIGTQLCSLNRRTGACTCTGKTPERCINIEYTRALTACRYGT